MQRVNQPRSLFRREVLLKQQHRVYGSLFINTPVSYRIISWLLAVLLLLILIFLRYFELSEKFIVAGYLDSTKGVVSVFTSKSGVIAKCFIQLGQQIKKGAILYRMNIGEDGINHTSYHQVLSKLLSQRNAIIHEINDKKQYLLVLAPLLRKKYITQASYRQQNEQLIALQQSKDSIDIKIMEHKQRQSYDLYAPVDGVVASINHHEGQYVHAEKLLLKIIPKKSKLIAQLFIPVKQSGFIQPNHQVILRLDAYPWSYFGTIHAKVKEVQQVVLTDAEDDKPIRIGEPYYKAMVELPNQSFFTNGQLITIKQGMTLTAVIVGPKQTLWKWFFAPIVHVTGSLQS
ncbi:MAG: HlyD family secretion protein [Legionella sp.]